MATINLLQALPQTPLWNRLSRESRLLDEEALGLESNVDFKLPYEQVLAMWRDCMAKAYKPQALFARYEYQMQATRPNRVRRPTSRQRLNPRNIKMGLIMLARVFWFAGLRSDYRRHFWKFAGRRLVRGEIEPILSVGLCAHHLILFAREVCAGRANASHYSAKARESLPKANRDARASVKLRGRRA